MREKTGTCQTYETKAGTRWLIRYQDPESGKRRTRGGYEDEETARFALRLIRKGRLEDALTLSEAEARTRKTSTPSSSGTAWSPKITRFNPATITMREWTERWIGSLRGDLSPTTIAGYKRSITNHVLPHFGDLRPRDIEPAMLNELYRHLLEDGRIKSTSNTRFHAKGATKSDKKAGLGANSVRKVHYALSPMFDAAVDAKIIDANPCRAKETRPPALVEVRFEKPRLNPWTEEQLEAFLDELYIVDPIIYSGVMLGSATGMRLGELVGLRIEAIDLDQRRIHVERNRVTYREDGMRHIVERMPKGNRARTVDIGEDGCLMLKEYMLGMELELDRELEPDDYLLLNTRRKPWTGDSLTARYRRSLAKVRRNLADRGLVIPAERFHDLRHSHATILIRKGVHPRIIQERLGHSTIQTTMQTYSHLLSSDQAVAADAIGGLYKRSGHGGAVAQDTQAREHSGA